jgi:hypothetical protein
MKNLVAALCFTLVAATALAADVTGTWKVAGDVYGNPVNLTCSLKQDGEKLSGKATLGEGQDVAVTGSVKDTTVSFEIDTPDKTYHLVFTGKLDADTSIKGSIAVAGVEGTFTAVKQ